ncbi:MAG: NADPH-dependent F420 reductase [Armatimonadota bacterium]|nr:NADPH-dependent F420 reductase [Armatimonadota bacterium]MDR7439454.1 NADPH-dependent F420 reductase [Armatimonadota bacterium]MDR7562903.1 NADPH-dependent F420 reductase [Armatimonadota bacterium]MDR7568167.1 NADPH-dependent F420 reductase [Armatimonadota bacterium]MDR7601460.1 NADPH-dependent F420 reductase [Armatimonadota bacterium]
MEHEIIAVIGGTGREGFGLGLRWATAGLPVILGSRSRERAEEAVLRARSLRPEAPISGALNREAAGAATVVLLAIPFAAQEAILSDIREAVRGKVVVDTTVPLRRLRPPELEIPPAGSAAQQAQHLLPEARVVAAFHTISAHRLQRLEIPLEEDTLVCGDDPEAKETVIHLSRRIGLRGLDAGGLHQAATLERLAALVLQLNQRYGKKDIGLRFVGL